MLLKTTSTTKSLLTIAIIASLGGTHVVKAYETATCEVVGSCPLTSAGYGGNPNGNLTTSASNNNNNSNTASLTNNKVTLNWTGASPQPNIFNVYGAFTQALNAQVKDNNVYINAGTVTNKVFGGYSKDDDAHHNNVKISGNASGSAAVTHIINNVYGGKSREGDANDNTVTISGGTLNGNIYGGHSQGKNANHNRVYISGGILRKKVYGGHTRNHHANDNTVNISGGTFTMSVYGGRAKFHGQANDNTVTISGGTLNGNIYGGKSNHGTTEKNTVTIKGTPSFDTNNTVLFGGSKQIYTGNTLNFHTKDITVKDVRNFEKYNFYLGNTVANNDTLLNLTSANTTNISSSTYGVGVEGGGSQLNKDDEIVLIKKLNGTLQLSNNNPNNTTTGMQGISTLYEFELSGRSTNSTSNNQLVATVTAAGINPQTKALLESKLATSAFVNRGTDLVSKDGIDAMVDNLDSIKGIKTFGVSSFGHSKTETGSHIDVKGSQFVIGASTDIRNSVGKVSIGGFTEFGFASYDAYNDFTNAANVTLSGNTNYYGVGVMANQTFNNNIYVNGGVSVGKIKTSFHSTDLKDSLGNATNFDSKRSYISGFAELGYDKTLNESLTIKPYVNLKLSRISSDNQTIAGDSFSFDVVNSVRSTLGTRLMKDFSTSNTAFVDLAWEHQFDGEASGQVFNMDIAEPTLAGDTGTIAIGVNVKPSSHKDMTLNFSAKGSFGQRTGISANAGFNYAF